MSWWSSRVSNGLYWSYTFGKVHTKASLKIKRLGRSVSQRRMLPLTMIDEKPTDGTSTSKKDQDEHGTMKSEIFSRILHTHSPNPGEYRRTAAKLKYWALDNLYTHSPVARTFFCCTVCLRTFTHLHALSHTRMAQGHQKRFIAHVLFLSISPSPFSWFTRLPRRSLTVIYQDKEKGWHWRLYWDACERDIQPLIYTSGRISQETWVGTDSDWAGCKLTGRSTSGRWAAKFLVFLNSAGSSEMILRLRSTVILLQCTASWRAVNVAKSCIWRWNSSGSKRWCVLEKLTSRRSLAKATPAMLWRTMTQKRRRRSTSSTRALSNSWRPAELAEGECVNLDTRSSCRREPVGEPAPAVTACGEQAQVEAGKSFIWPRFSPYWGVNQDAKDIPNYEPTEDGRLVQHVQRHKVHWSCWRVLHAVWRVTGTLRATSETSCIRSGQSVVTFLLCVWFLWPSYFAWEKGLPSVVSSHTGVQSTREYRRDGGLNRRSVWILFHPSVFVWSLRLSHAFPQNQKKPSEVAAHLVLCTHPSVSACICLCVHDCVSAFLLTTLCALVFVMHLNTHTWYGGGRLLCVVSAATFSFDASVCSSTFHIEVRLHILYDIITDVWSYCLHWRQGRLLPFGSVSKASGWALNWSTRRISLRRAECSSGG